jgi:pyruvate dehydrogenase E1 component beta subunit
MFADDLTISMDQLVNSAAKARYLYNGTNGAPMVMRAANGATGTGAGPHHSQSLEAFFVHVPGFIVVMPSTPADAKGLLKSSIRCDDPVIFLEPKLLYFTKGPVPEGEHLVPLGKADVKREGRELTVVAMGSMVPRALAAAESFQKDGVSVEVVDPRTLKPLDKATIIASLKKTGRLIIVEEACKTGSFGAQIASVVAEEAFEHLKAPIGRVAAPDTPVPASKHLEGFFIPNERNIVDAVRKTISY